MTSPVPSNSGCKSFTLASVKIPKIYRLKQRLIEHRPAVEPEIVGILAEELQTLINQGLNRVQDLAKHFNVLQVELESLKEHDPSLDSFINVNSREDYERLLKRFT